MEGVAEEEEEVEVVVVVEEENVQVEQWVTGGEGSGVRRGWEGKRK